MDSLNRYNLTGGIKIQFNVNILLLYFWYSKGI